MLTFLLDEHTGFSSEFKECSEHIFLSKFSVYSIENIDERTDSEFETNYDVVVNAHVNFVVVDGDRTIGDFTHDHIVTIDVTEVDDEVLLLQNIDVYEDE